MFPRSFGNEETLNFHRLTKFGLSVSTTWHLAQSLLETYSGNIKRTVNTD